MSNEGQTIDKVYHMIQDISFTIQGPKIDKLFKVLQDIILTDQGSDNEWTISGDTRYFICQPRVKQYKKFFMNYSSLISRSIKFHAKRLMSN